MVGRPSQAAETRRTILDGAARVFSRQGYRGTSVNEIAAAVGLSKPTLYHYFRNKEEILVRLYEEVMTDAVDNATQVTESVDRPIDALRQLLVYRVRTTCERQPIYKVFFEEEAELPGDLLATVIDQRHQYERLLRSQIERHLDEMGDGRPDIDPTIYLNSILGAANWVYKWYSKDGDRTPAELGEEIASYVLQPLTALHA